MKLNGWLLIDKPLGLTSNNATHRVKGILRPKKIGHGGTLDPLASGLLPIALGEATKTVPWVMDKEKTYIFTVQWGLSTTTDDTEGDIVARSEARPSPLEIKRLLPRFLGPIDQKPPAYSALKINGKRSYTLARQGVFVDLAPRKIMIHDFQLLDVLPDQATFEVTCGKGTYIRSLARDLALALGTFGHVASLRRTRIGCFSVQDAILLDLLEKLGHSPEESSSFFSICDALDDISGIGISEQEAKDLRLGRFIKAPSELSEDLFLCSYQGSAVALVRLEKGRLQPFRVFNDE